jgi:hypothetical protein
MTIDELVSREGPEVKWSDAIIGTPVLLRGLPFRVTAFNVGKRRVSCEFDEAAYHALLKQAQERNQRGQEEKEEEAEVLK